MMPPPPWWNGMGPDEHGIGTKTTKTCTKQMQNTWLAARAHTKPPGSGCVPSLREHVSRPRVQSPAWMQFPATGAAVNCAETPAIAAVANDCNSPLIHSACRPWPTTATQAPKLDTVQQQGSVFACKCTDWADPAVALHAVEVPVPQRNKQ